MSQWIKKLPLAPIYMATLLLELYYVIFSRQLPALLLLIMSCFFLLWQYSLKRVAQVALILSASAIFFGMTMYQSESSYQTEPETLETIVLLPDTIKINGDLLSFIARGNGRSYQAFYTLKSKEEKRSFEALYHTQRMRVTATLEEAPSQRNFSGFDYRAFLKTQGINRLLKIEKILNQESISVVTPRGWIREWRRLAIIQCSRFQAPMRHYMTGLLFGYFDKSFDEMEDLYKNLGIIHLFALSGMHVSCFVGLFRKLCLHLGMTRERVLFAQVPFSFIYGGFAGFSISVTRSLIQQFLTQCGLKKMDNFAITVMLSFIIMPFFLLTTGGVMSFSFAFVLTLFDVSHFSKNRIKWVSLLVIPLGVLPILLYFFASYQPLSILLTVGLAFLFESLILPLLTFAFLLSPIICLNIFNKMFQLLDTILASLSHFAGKPLVFGTPSVVVLLVLLVLMGLLYDYHKRKYLCACLVLGLLGLLFITKHPMTNEVTMVDIGQGDSIFIRDIFGKTLLIDVGGKVSFSQKKTWQKGNSDSNAERTLIPYLKSRGISKIDQLLLTHTDTDHMGDMEVVAKTFEIGEVLVSPGSLTNSNFVNRLKSMQVHVRSVVAGEQLPIMNSSLQVLYPFTQGDGKNNDSLVLYGNLLGTRFLFTGDLEKEGEEVLLKHYPQLSVDVLKAGHHGSKGSSSMHFLETIKPKMTLISAGQNNRYHHPHQETLERLAKVNSRFLRTDEHGAIRFIGWQTWHLETVR
ncbi:DNA internalization-related competence protein ComEC/Rec2 [Streptococcus sciuri]|uniref:DNA internalization-related competence protein ComEC/Rec2 n=1 Tax=Streptococcus sciuri TaxID=2973939 RepID=A0ABT2F798_9STRE|nr:DNA internalization-related competence protein ComEC/Rec2 [Streptococcus sciuri]MCS4488294.1 DNA internalization-related competence protein ComEC/Rec2 [Streptococcus sciuri]